MIASLVALVALAVFAFAALVASTHLLRGTPLERLRPFGDGPPAAGGGDAFVDAVAAHAQVRFSTGNRLDVLFDGDGVYPALWEALGAARDWIAWHVFWFKPGELADRLHRVLSERAAAGVRVLFLYDAYGARGTPESYFASLRAAGVEVVAFRPLRWRELYKFQQRSHMRVAVVDGRIGITGGFAIDDRWAGGGRRPGEWRDTSVRVEGPAVEDLMAAFAADWAEATGELLVGVCGVAADRAEGGSDTRAGLLYASPAIGSTTTERCYALSLGGARETLYVTNAYFVPSTGFRRLLVEAVGRGVDVRVLTPGARTDRPSTWYAGRRHYEELLAGGVRIYEYRPTMLHAKTLCADDVWAMIGTANFDNRSMSLNNEVALLAHDPPVARRLRERFLSDLELADELDLDAFRRRSAWERAKERTAALGERLL